MSDLGTTRLDRRGLLRGLAGLAVGWTAVVRLARAAGGAGADSAGAATTPEAVTGPIDSLPTATVWLGYPVHDPSGRFETYRPPRRIGSADRLPSVFWSA